MPLPRRHRLSSAEARTACYIDFEGRKDQAPVLLGWAVQAERSRAPRIQQVLLESRFAPLRHPSDPLIASLPAIIETITAQAEAQDRLIVTWSEHELRLVTAYCPPVLAARFEARFVNARKVAVRWSSTQSLENRPAGHRLLDYLTWVGYPLPADADGGRVGSTIRQIEQTLDRGTGRHSVSLTANQIHRFEQLRTHNRHDCLGMRLVCHLAADGLERAARRQARPARHEPL